jgi:hypothetical protein
VGINAIYLPEFLSTDWSPSAFDQLLAALAPAGIEFVCSSQIERSYIESVPGSARMALTELSGTPLFDPVRDFIDGAVTRNDIFVKQPNRNFDNLAYFSELHFSSLLPESAIKPELRLGENLIELRGSLYDPLIYWLSLMPITPAELRQHRDLAHFEPAEIIQAIHLLIAARQMLPFAAPAPPFAEIGLANFKIGSDWNRQVLANLAPTMDAVWLASPMAGQGIRLSLSDAWILGGIAAAGTDGATSWLATRLEDPAWATVVPGADLSSSDHRKLAAAIRLREFLETYMLKCLSLGILTT